MTSFMLVATFFALWLSVHLPLEFEVFLSYLLISTFGILHGANDIEVLRTYFRKKDTRISKARITVSYIVLIIAICSTFYFFPAIALVLFIVFSGYHFGEQHWNRTLEGKFKGKAFFFIFYGGFVLFMLFYAHQIEVVGIVTEITGRNIPANIIVQLCAGLGITVSIFLIYYAFLGLNWYTILLEVFLLGVFFVIFNTASLVFAFSIYFVLWHSIPSIFDQLQFLYGEVSWKSFFGFLKSSYVYWLASIIGTLGLYLFLSNIEAYLVPGLIIFLASITIPHVLVMTRIEEHLKTHPKTHVGRNTQ